MLDNALQNGIIYKKTSYILLNQGIRMSEMQVCLRFPDGDVIELNILYFFLYCPFCETLLSMPFQRFSNLQNVLQNL